MWHVGGIWEPSSQQETPCHMDQLLGQDCMILRTCKQTLESSPGLRGMPFFVVFMLFLLVLVRVCRFFKVFPVRSKQHKLK